jgi:acyl carrier protein
VSGDLIDQSIPTQIREFVAKDLLFSPDGFRYADDTSFLEEGIIDSLGVMELVGFVQKSFGLRVEQDEVIPENFGSVALLTGYVLRKRGASVAVS